MRTIKRVIIFLLAFAMLNGLLTFALSSPSEVKLRVGAFQQGDENALILGHSLSRDGIDPRYLNDEDHKVYNMSFPIILQMFEPILKEMQQERPIEKLYIEMAYPYYLEEEYDSHGGISYDSRFAGYMLKHDPVRAVKLLSQEKFTELLFPYHLTAWTLRSIPRTVRNKLSAQYRSNDAAILDEVIKNQEVKYLGQGFVGRYSDVGEEFNQVGTPFEPEEIVPAAREDFKNLVNYCRENGIEVVAFACAVPPDRLKSEPFDQVHGFYQELCEPLGVPLYDMNYLKWENLPRDAEDFQDLNGHAMADFAARQAQMLHTVETSDDPQQYFAEDYQQVLDGICEYEEKTE